MATKNYLINWPNGTISIIAADNPYDLFWRMDEEGDPTCPENEIYILPERFHIGTQLIDGKIQFSNYEDDNLKRYKFPKNFTDRAFQRAYRQTLHLRRYLTPNQTGIS